MRVNLNAEHKLKIAVETSIDFILESIDFTHESSSIVIKAFRIAVFNKYGYDSLNYLDKQIRKIRNACKGSWAGGSNDYPISSKD